ncbi:MAG: hypothetical protein MJZ65_00840 [Paludibacteraceae bacterium]|nr:hypothetical protein [Paludibacteraceae bacterium]
MKKQYVQPVSQVKLLAGGLVMALAASPDAQPGYAPTRVSNKNSFSPMPK